MATGVEIRVFLLAQVDTRFLCWNGGRNFMFKVLYFAALGSGDGMDYGWIQVWIKQYIIC